MPWADVHQAGLVFVAFGNSFDAFDALLRRMVGAEDGIVDAFLVSADGQRAPRLAVAWRMMKTRSVRRPV